MSILDTIRQHKLIEIAERKLQSPVTQLEQGLYFKRQCISLKAAVENPAKNGIVAEFKRRSPSKGDINQNADAAAVTSGYLKAGASALSVLTDSHFFGAKEDDFAVARVANNCAILRKDFVLDEYQIVEAKSMGADAILLIAKMLSVTEVNKLTTIAHQLGMEVLLETHTEAEVLQNIDTLADIVGINNRNLNTFDVDIKNSIRLAEMLPKHICKIAESGIESADTIRTLRQQGFNGFLIGEYFMRRTNPAEQCSKLIQQLVS